MNPSVNLHILAERFTQLSRSVYFDSAFREFSFKIADVIQHVLKNDGKYPDQLVRAFEQQVWRVMKFVRGSRSNEAPHETQFVLRRALKHWVPEDVLVSSAVLEEFNFFLNTEDVWDLINKSLNLYDSGGYKPLVVRIGSPEAYKHRPVFCIPLLHELGHFVDLHYEISKTSLFLSPPAPAPSGVDPAQWNFVNLRHRMEYFADIFSACHCGTASHKSLTAIAPSNPDSATHPATTKRVEVVDAFLAGTANDKVDLLQNACKARTGKLLEPRFSIPDVTTAFDDVLTYKIESEDQLFGIFLAGWDYMSEQLSTRSASWIDADIEQSGIEKTINDLVEKSIRNFEITERWKSVSSN